MKAKSEKGRQCHESPADAPQSSSDKVHQFQILPHLQCLIVDISIHSNSININSEQNPVLSIMEKQNEITSMLPKGDIQIFDGDPLHYHAFLWPLEQVIKEKTYNAEDACN